MFALRQVQQIARRTIVCGGGRFRTLGMSAGVRRVRASESSRGALDEIAEHGFVIFVDEFLLKEQQRFADNQRSIRLRPTGALEQVGQAIGFLRLTFVEAHGDDAIGSSLASGHVGRITYEQEPCGYEGHGFAKEFGGRVRPRMGRERILGLAFPRVRHCPRKSTGNGCSS